jgi:lysophospholipase L1-like esterase
MAPALARGDDTFELKDGDRVVFLGNALIEREQRYGYWELALTSRYPDRNILFRNLGWSGDTVFGEARAGFGTVADGFRRLKEQVFAFKPTVILIGYGGNEAFDGPDGLPHFVEGMNILLDALAPTKARVVLLSPLPHENLGPPLPDPAEINKHLQLYSEALRELADKRQCRFVDLYRPLIKEMSALRVDRGTPQYRAPLTDDGMHLTAYGYSRTAVLLEDRLGWKPRLWLVTLGSDGTVAEARGTKVEQVRTDPLRFEATDTVLPFPRAMDGNESVTFGRILQIVGGPSPRDFSLRVDGKVIAVEFGKLKEGDRLLQFALDPEEKLRQVIIAKNRLFFYRWRPQNETYLFGFRKHEQGQNAKEVPEFDPLIEKLEAEIATLRKPVKHTYELTPREEKPK